MRIQLSRFALLLSAITHRGILAWSPSLGPSSSFAGGRTKPDAATSSASSSPSPPIESLSSSPPEPLFSRRQAWRQAVNAAAAVSSGFAVAAVRPFAASAYPDEETPRVVTRMGGLLEAFQDGARGVRLMAPSGWNKFEGEVGAYDIKWQDLVDPSENIKISSTPVKSTTESVQVLGEVKDLGSALAAKRNARLVRATERLTDGILFYLFEFSIGDGTHQLLQLCVCKGKLWSIDASSKESRWSKRAELYENVMGSFMPKLA